MSPHRLRITLGLVLVLVVGAALRFHGLNWDSGQHLHPDERFLAIVGNALRFPASPLDYFDTRRSPLNPYNQGFDGFAYGTAPLFLVRAVAEWLGRATYDQLPSVGRALSALFDLGTVLLVFLLGRLVYGSVVGLVAAAISATTVLHIQLSHFFAVDTFLAFTTTLALYAAYRTWLRGGNGNVALLGLALGLGVGTKLSAALLLPIVVMAALVPAPNGARRTLVDRLVALLLCGAVALLVYRVVEPYSFDATSPLGFRPNVQRFTDLERWVKISSGEIEVPFMIQWANTPNPRYALTSLVTWGFGAAAGLSALAGLVLATLELRRWPTGGRHLLLVAWAGINLFYFGFQFAKFMRYFLPAYPALAVLAGWLLVEISGRLATRVGRPFAPMLRLVAPGVVAATAVYALMFSQIYTRPNTRVQASEWIYANIAPGSTLGVEHWDDGLPLRLPGREQKYADVSMQLYDDDTPEKARRLADNLRKADYLILASNRLYGSIPRLPQRYPLGVEYYRLLFSGGLGFDLVARLDSEPSLLGLTLDSSGAQEDFTVYDHPVILIFKKSDAFSGERVATLLSSVPLDTVERIKPVEAANRSGLMLSPEEWGRVVAGGTWSERFALDGVAATFALPLWLLAVEALALAALPICWWLCPGLPDRGFALAKVLGLVLVAYVTWLLASVAGLPNGPGLAFGALAALAGLGLFVASRRRATLLADLRERRALLLLTEAVFLGAFALWALVRSLNPDLWHPSYGGEKPMDFAYFNAVVKAPSFPPYDPWFAGGYVNYYYYGFVLMAVPVNLTAVPPAQAYNLAVATIFGLTAVTAFGFGAALVGGPRWRRSRVPLRWTAAAGLISAAALCLFGNLDAPLQLLEGLWKLGSDGVQSSLPGLTGLTRALSGLLALVLGGSLGRFDFWRSTRFIGPEDPGPIHEFPYFTFLYGDLHAHMISLPLQVTLALICLQLVRLASREVIGLVTWRRAADLLRAARGSERTLALLGLSALLVGTLRVTNTWELPTYLGLATLAGAVALGPGRYVGWLRAAFAAVALLVGLYALSSALFWPFLARYELFYSGVLPIKTPTLPRQFLLVNGFLLFAAVSVLAYSLRRAWPRVVRPERLAQWRTAAAGAYYSVAVPLPTSYAERLAAGVAAVALGLGVGLAALGRGSLGIVAALLIALVTLVVLRHRSRERLWWAAMLATALGALALPELIAVKGDVGRMNTVFKFWLQAWVLLSLLAGPSIIWLLRRAAASAGRAASSDECTANSDERGTGSAERGTGSARSGGHQSWWVAAWVVALALLAASAALYPLLATPAKLGARFAPLPPTLDGMAFMDHAAYTDKGRDLDLAADADAIRWMLANVEGSPVILEGHAPLYHWGSRFSVYTGLPTVLGWDWHQKQQRWAYQSRVEERQRDVATAYDSPSPDAAIRVLRKYAVRYVVVGGLERAYYATGGLDKFDRMIGQGLDVAYRSDGVTIYRVAGT